MRKVENMNKCSAAFLMGCCSGLPYRGGRYVPKSVPISFLLAGSPVIVATLWDVPEDISQFVKAMLESFWRERSDDVKPERIGSLMADARYACAQQFLTGAAIRSDESTNVISSQDSYVRISDVHKRLRKPTTPNQLFFNVHKKIPSRDVYD
ncbi:hypothetical protein YC2023_049464 [Brassica napus]